MESRSIKTAKIFGDETTFVLSNSGHLQSLLNPPTNKKASFVAGAANAPDGSFSQRGEKRSGSWWPHWRDWLFERSGAEVPRAATLATIVIPLTQAAPGTYVFELMSEAFAKPRARRS